MAHRIIEKPAQNNDAQGRYISEWAPFRETSGLIAGLSTCAPTSISREAELAILGLAHSPDRLTGLGSASHKVRLQPGG